jgi:hypothetical protein
MIEEVSMIGTLGIGSPATQFGQSTVGLSPYSSYPIAAPFTLQTSPYLQSLPHVPFSYGMTAPGAYAQPLQPLLQILPQQLGQLNQVLQQQVHGLQQLLQIVPQQLHQIQQLLQILPQQIHQLQVQTQPQPFGAQAGFGGSWQQPIGGASSWGQPTAGVSVGSQAFPGQPGPVM